MRKQLWKGLAEHLVDALRAQLPPTIISTGREALKPHSESPRSRLPSKSWRRSGVPVQTPFPPMAFAASGKVVSTALANGAESLLASPGVMSLS